MDSNLTYEDAGVSINTGNDLISRIKPLAKSTNNTNVIDSIGGFAGLFELPLGYKKPVLVAATDGVGTKLKLAQELNYHKTIGIDLVAMCVNDIIVTGAKPLFFLDYYATGKLDINTAQEVIASICAACSHTDMSLLGGETAEMPGIYHNKDYDLAGFCVGVCEKEHLVNKANLNPGDVLIGLTSSGLHSNGFSLVRKILELNNILLTDKISEINKNTTIGEILLTPTVLYYDPLYNLINNKKVKACAHITGGGLLENTLRVIPDNLYPNFRLENFSLSPIFKFLQQQGNITDTELWRVFNCGIGMVLITKAELADYIIDYYNNYDFTEFNKTSAFVIGEIIEK